MLRSMAETDRADRAKILKALRSRFGPAGKESVFQAELAGRKRRPGETLSELGDNIHVLCTRAYPGVSDDVFQVIAVRSYLDALSSDLDALSSDLRRRVGDHEPRTLQDAVRKAMVLETQDLAEESRLVGDGPLIAAAKSDVSPLDVLTKAFECLEASQSATLSVLSRLCDSLPSGEKHYDNSVARGVSNRSGDRSRQSKTARTSDVRCFNCNGVGHFRRDCPSLKGGSSLNQ